MSGQMSVYAYTAKMDRVTAVKCREYVEDAFAVDNTFMHARKTAYSWIDYCIRGALSTENEEKPYQNSCVVSKVPINPLAGEETRDI